MCSDTLILQHEKLKLILKKVPFHHLVYFSLHIHGKYHDTSPEADNILDSNSFFPFMEK